MAIAAVSDLLATMTDHAKGRLMTTLGILFIVPDSLFIRLVDADTLTIAFWRNLSAGVTGTLGLVLLTRGRTVEAVRATGWQGVVYSIGSCAGGIMFVAAVKLTSVANVVFILASMPMFAALYSWLALGERIGRRMLLTMLVVAAGVAIIAYGSGGNEQTSIWGDLIALSLAAMFAGILTVARTKREVPMAPAVPFSFLGAALLLAPFSDIWSVPDGQYWIVIMHGGVFIAMAMTLMSIGPQYITSAEVALLVLLETVLAPLLVWGFLGENPGSWTLLGGAVVLGALLISNLVVLMRRSTG